MNLQSILGKQVLGVLAYYYGEKITVNICAIYPNSDNSLRVFFHNGHRLAVDDFATVHLDNRTGVDEFDANISVYRSSYKGLMATGWCWRRGNASCCTALRRLSILKKRAIATRTIRAPIRRSRSRH